MGQMRLVPATAEVARSTLFWRVKHVAGSTDQLQMRQIAYSGWSRYDSCMLDQPLVLKASSLDFSNRYEAKLKYHCINHYWSELKGELDLYCTASFKHTCKDCDQFISLSLCFYKTLSQTLVILGQAHPKEPYQIASDPNPRPIQGWAVL